MLVFHIKVVKSLTVETDDVALKAHVSKPHCKGRFCLLTLCC